MDGEYVKHVVNRDITHTTAKRGTGGISLLYKKKEIKDHNFHYTAADNWSNLENQLQKYQCKGEVISVGDFNARTATLPDYIMIVLTI